MPAGNPWCSRFMATWHASPDHARAASACLGSEYVRHGLHVTVPCVTIPSTLCVLVNLMTIRWSETWLSGLRIVSYAPLAPGPLFP